MADIVKIDRDYSDNISIKEFVVDELLPKYFPDTEVSVRTSGTIGFVSEEISNISEDSFNTSSVYFREAFVNRAQLSESIYSHAAVFQLNEIFATAATCRFLLVLKEESIIKNMTKYYDQDTGIYHFYIGRDTTIYVEDIPFVLDYPVCINIIKKEGSEKIEYLFTANYIMTEYNNSISKLSSPYVKVRRNKNGYIAIEVMTHQCTRYENEYPVVSTNVINYPVIDVKFKGTICGFDVLYKGPNETEFNTQLKTLLVYTQAITEPFCYYQMLNDNTIRITFNTKDNFYMPEFNSTLKVIVYLTKGKGGEFPTYEGTDVSVIPDDNSYQYSHQYLVACQPIGGSFDAKDVSDITDIQALAVEGYRTANALTTANDLDTFFSNYKIRYGNSNIKFIRKRDDVSERVFGAFILMKNGDYIYKTNTLNLKMNLSDFTVMDNNVYMLEPGYLFTANDNSGYAEFVVDEVLQNEYLEEYEQAKKDGTIPYIEDIYDPTEIPSYLNRPASFAEFKRRKGYEDKLTVFDLGIEDMKPYDDPNDKKFLLINPFLIKFKKNPNLLSCYLTYMNDDYLIDFTDQNEDSFVQFILYTVNVKRKFEKAKKYRISTVIGPSITVSKNHPIVNPSEVNLEGEPISYYVNDKYAVIDNDLRVLFVIYNNNSPVCYIEMYPSSYDIDTDNFEFTCDFLTDDYITNNNKLRLLSETIYRNYENGEYYKVHDDDATLYTHYDKNDNILERSVPVDIVTTLTRTGILTKFSNVNNMSASADILIPMEDVECKIFTIYNRYFDPVENDLMPYNADQTNNIFSEYNDTYLGYVWTNEYSTGIYPITFMKILDNVRCTLMYEDYTDCTKVPTEEGEEIVYKHDIMDVRVYSIPFIKWDIGFSNDSFAPFIDIYKNIYDFTRTIMMEKLRNITALDLKFYNTYGRSKNFFIGENEEIIDTVVLLLNLDIFYIPGTEFATATPQVKNFIKETIETVNEYGQNDLYISNLIRKIENKFAFVDHLRFNYINYYDSSYQAVKNNTVDVDELTVEERRFYVPEFLICDIDNIIINEYYANEA